MWGMGLNFGMGRSNMIMEVLVIEFYSRRSHYRAFRQFFHKRFKEFQNA
jgi:hypothetical protein